MLGLAGIFQQQDAAPPAGGEAPTVVSITPTIVTSGTTHNISLGATVSAGDLLIIIAACDGGTADVPATTAANWTRIVTFNSLAGAAVFKKLATGSEGGTTIDITTPSTEYLAAQCFRIQTWSGDIADVASLGTTGSSATVSPPALTSGFGAVPTLWIGAAATSATATLTSSPADYTVTETGATGTANGQIRTGWRQLTAASETPGGFGVSFSTEWSSATVAVRGTG